MNLSEYILQPRETRIAHIDLNTPCELVSPATFRNAIRDRTSIFEYFELENDVGNLSVAGICRNHVCSCDSKAPEVCVNPLHMYIGTRPENLMDVPLEVRQKGMQAMWEVLRQDLTEDGKVSHCVASGRLGGQARHVEKDELGRSLAALQMNKVVHAERTEDGKSAHAVRCGKANNAEKDEQGRSVMAVRGSTVLHAEKTEDGKSKAAVKQHLERDSEGRSVAAMRMTSAAVRKIRKAVQVTHTETGDVFWYDSITSAVEAVGIHRSAFLKHLKRGTEHPSGHKFEYLSGPNPFY